MKISPQVIKDEVERCCPLLEVLFTRTSGPIMSELLVNAFKDLKETRVHYEHITSDIVMAILAHQESLQYFLTSNPLADFFEKEDVASVRDHLR